MTPSSGCARIASWRHLCIGVISDGRRGSKGASLTIFALALLSSVVGASDSFRVLKEPSPREAAVFREMIIAANRTVGTRPWDGKRVVVALTTTPKRIHLIEPTLDSLLLQSHSADVVYLFVPYTFSRDGSSYEIPPFLHAKVGVTIVRCVDHGPGTHMLEVLKLERHPDTYILQVDDDQAYGKNLLAELLSATGPLPGRSIGAATQHGHTHLGSAVNEGVHGVLFQRKFFGPDVFHYQHFDPTCRLHDDLWLSAHLASRSIRRENLGERFGSKALIHGYGMDALYRGGAGSDNTRNFYLCLSSLFRVRPHLWKPVDRVIVTMPLLRGFGANLQASSAALEQLRRAMSRRPVVGRRGSGPDALYLFGAVSEAMRKEAADEALQPSLEVPTFVFLRFGEGTESIDVVLKDCLSDPSACDISSALESTLRFEEDPETIVVVVDSSRNPKALPKLLREHVACHGARPVSSKAFCRGPRGSWSFRRHSAYDEGRINSQVYLPIFSDSFHVQGGWLEGFKMARGGALWRDSPNDRWKLAPTNRIAFDNFLTVSSRSTRSDHRYYLHDYMTTLPRVVATLRTSSLRVRFPLLRATLRSLTRQKLPLRRIHISIRGADRVRHCAPAWLRSWPRVHCVCGLAEGAVLTNVVAREAKAETLIIYVDDAHRYGDELSSKLVTGGSLWPGQAVASSGVIYGALGGPVGLPNLGVLFRRSFLDTRLHDELKGPCASTPSLVLAAHLSLKGIRTISIGDNFKTRKLRWSISVNARSAKTRGLWGKCRELCLTRHPWLWASVRPERCVVFVSLLEQTDSLLLDLTLRYAGLQTRKADEVVILASKHELWNGSQNYVTRLPLDVELELDGPLGSGTVSARTSDGRRPAASLPYFLAALRGRVGCVVRVRPQFGPQRSFILSVRNCLDGRCHSKAGLAIAFDHELQPDTGLMFVRADRLVNERLVEDNLRCINDCNPNCNSQNWCGQPPDGIGGEGLIYDLTVRRSAGYREVFV